MWDMPKILPFFIQSRPLYLCSVNNLEIERKFLVTDLRPLDSTFRDLEDGTPGTSMIQGYLPVRESGRSIRVRVMPEQATICFKGPRDGAIRIELESGISVDLGQQLLHLCGDRIVSKMRYPIVEAGGLWVIDVFQDENEGLVLAEIELGSPDEEVIKPSWCGEEVTEDDRYYNQYLAEHPFRSWA